MNLSNEENVKKVVEFYVDNAMGMAQSIGMEADAKINIRIIPNTDKNIDAKFVVVGSGKIEIPGREEGLVNIVEKPEDSEETPEDAAKTNAEIVND